MKMSYFEQHGLLVLRFRGYVPFESFISESAPLIAEAYVKHGKDKPLHRLTDFRGATMELTTAHLKTLAMESNRLGESFNSGKAAFLADSDLMFGVLRQYEQIGCKTALERGVFRDLGKALGWLGIDPKLAQKFELDD